MQLTVQFNRNIMNKGKDNVYEIHLGSKRPKERERKREEQEG